MMNYPTEFRMEVFGKANQYQSQLNDKNQNQGFLPADSKKPFKQYQSHKNFKSQHNIMKELMKQISKDATPRQMPEIALQNAKSAYQNNEDEYPYNMRISNVKSPVLSTKQSPV